MVQSMIKHMTSYYQSNMVSVGIPLKGEIKYFVPFKIFDPASVSRLL